MNLIALKQKLFDTVIQALIDQGQASVASGTTTGATSNFCQYRSQTVDGVTLKCAVGHLIPDDMYNVYMGGKSSTTLFVDHPEIFQTIIQNLGFNISDFGDDARADVRSLLRGLQRVHDNAVGTRGEEFKNAMRKLIDESYTHAFVGLDTNF